MTYRVFDAGINKLFGVFPTEVEAMRLVRALLKDDEDYANDLAVSCEADDGSFVPPRSGSGLIARVGEAVAEQGRVENRRRQVASLI